MGRYWKRRYYQNQRELRKQRKRMKILLALTVSIVVIFGSLLLVGYAGKQIQETANDVIDSTIGFIFGWISQYESTIIGIAVLAFFVLIVALVIWSWIPESTPKNTGGGY